MKIAITLIEQGNSKAPNIGTIVGVSEEELAAKAIKAIESHFAGIVTSIRIQDKLKFSDIKCSPPIDVYATIDGYEAVIEAQETWIY